MDQPDVVVKEWKDSALGQYSIPFGRREPGENIFEAASREGREET
jgi:8-oxo-dGTP pyrophosphatase MutT (NUDIX family)